MRFQNRHVTARDLERLRSSYGSHPSLSAIEYSIREESTDVIMTIDDADNDIFIINVPNVVYDGRMYEKYLLFKSRYYLCEFRSVFTNEVLVNSYDGSEPPAEVLAILEQALPQRRSREGRYGDYCFAKQA